LSSPKKGDHPVSAIGLVEKEDADRYRREISINQGIDKPNEYRASIERKGIAHLQKQRTLSRKTDDRISFTQELKEWKERRQN
jgi:hypothetical protein